MSVGQFGSKKGRATLDAMASFICERNGVDVLQVAKALSVCPSSAANYLRRGAALDLVHPGKPRVRVGNRGNVPVLWFGGPTSSPRVAPVEAPVRDPLALPANFFHPTPEPETV